MNILIYANCQTYQLVYGITLALAGKAKVHGIDINNAKHNDQLRQFCSESETIDYVITNQHDLDLSEYFTNDQVVEIPTIHFGGFHPDVIYFSSQSEPDKPLGFMNNPTVSALALWTAINNINKINAASLYNEEVFSKLGYIDYFDVACKAIRTSYAKYEINLSNIDKHLASRDVFMHGPIHPKFEVTLSLCFGILEKLNIQPVMSYHQIKNAVIDPLQNEYYWGCFPPIAEHLGVDGSWLIRHRSHVFSSIPNYLDSFHTFIHDIQQQYGAVQMLERDKDRFESFHKIDNVLRSYL